MMDGLLTPSEVAAARRKCTIVEEDEEEALEVDVKPAAVCDDSGLKTMSRSSSTDHAATLDLASVLQNFTTIKPLLPPDASEPSEPTPAPFPVASQIGTGLSRQNSLRRSETSGSNSGAASPATTPPGSTPSSSQGSPARYKLGSGRKLANTRSSPQLILNQIHEEAEEGSGSVHLDPVDNFPQTSAGAVVIRRLEQRRKMRFHKSRTTSCSSSDASDDENAGSDSAVSKRPPRPEKTPTPPPIGKEPHDDSSDSNQDPGASTANPSGMASLSLSSRSRSRTNESHQNAHQTGKGPSSNDENLEGEGAQGAGGHVLNSRRNRAGHLTRVRQSRSLNRISELHVVADFSENEDMLTRYLDSVNLNRAQTRSRDDSLTSSDGEFEGSGQQQQSQRRTKVNLRLLEQRLNKIQEESLHNLKNEDEKPEVPTAEETDAGGTDGDVSDNVSTVADDFAPPPLTTKTILIEDKENHTLSETTSVKSCVVTTSKKPQHPRLNRAHSCGSLFSLKERALLRKKLSSHVTAAFLDILSNTNVSASEVEVNKKQQTDLTLALKTNPLAVFQLQSSRCCNLC